MPTTTRVAAERRAAMSGRQLAVPPGPWNFSEARVQVRSALNGGPDRDLELFPRPPDRPTARLTGIPLCGRATKSVRRCAGLGPVVKADGREPVRLACLSGQFTGGRLAVDIDHLLPSEYLSVATNVSKC